MASPLNDPKLEALLDRLHAQSEAQVEEINAHISRRAKAGTLDREHPFDEELHRFFSDKMVALERDKAEFCYLLCRSLQASRVVEAGNQVRDGVVIGTEYEPKKVQAARANFNQAGLDELIERRFVILCGYRSGLGAPGGQRAHPLQLLFRSLLLSHRPPLPRREGRGRVK